MAEFAQVSFWGGGEYLFWFDFLGRFLFYFFLDATKSVANKSTREKYFFAVCLSV